MTAKIDKLPRHFVWRRLHSLAGLWLVLFLCEHLITNSQAALLLGDSGRGFVRMVNAIHDLPYLTVIEVSLLGIPILIHAILGIQYAFTSRFNSMKNDGSKPHLSYARNRAFTWQRITSWILVVLLTMHVVKFRFLDYPKSVNTGTEHPAYFVEISMDPGLYTVAQRLGVTLYDQKALDGLKAQLDEHRNQQALLGAARDLRSQDTEKFSTQNATILETAQSYEQKRHFIEKILSFDLKKGEVVASSPSFGTASLLNVRNTFKSPLWTIVYTAFVLSAVFHAFNGLWTSMLTWGFIIKSVAQTRARKCAISVMFGLAFLGLAAVWGTYFINLKS